MKPGRELIWCSLVGGIVIICCFSGCALAWSWNGQWSWNCNPGTPTQSAGILRGVVPLHQVSVLAARWTQRNHVVESRAEKIPQRLPVAHSELLPNEWGDLAEVTPSSQAVLSEHCCRMGHSSRFRWYVNSLHNVESLFRILYFKQ